MLKKWILFFAAIVILALVFAVPLYNHWLFTNILTYDAVIEQAHYMSLEERRKIRFGKSYIMYSEMADILKAEGGTDPVLLLPPDAYVRQLGIKDFRIVEPLEFYYFTGIKSVTIESSDVQRASWTLAPAKDPPMVLVRITSAQELEEYISVFKKFQPH
jgi:hypothetical protein